MITAPTLSSRYYRFASHPRSSRTRRRNEAASNAFFDGFQIAVRVAVAITLVGAVAAAILIPSQPPQTACEPIEISGPQVSPQRP
jgi:hypothetical protein